MRRWLIAGLLAAAVVSWVLPWPDVLWVLGLPVAQFASLMLLACAGLVWAAPLAWADPGTSLLWAWAAALVLGLTMTTDSPIFLLAAAVALATTAIRHLVSGHRPSRP